MALKKKLNKDASLDKLKTVNLLLDSFSNVCNGLQNILDNQNYFLHHVYLIHQTLFSGFLKKKQKREKNTDNDEEHGMSNVGQDRQRPVYLCAIMCDLSIEWPVMSKHCTSSDYAFEMRQTQCSEAVMWMAERFQLLSTTYNRAVAQKQHNQDSMKSTQNGHLQSGRLDDPDKTCSGLTT